MKHGIHVPAIAVRIMVAALAAATLTAVALSAPDMMRYMKISRM